MAIGYGSKLWFIPDGYYPEKSAGDLQSHEAVCVLNPGRREANITLTLYFEDREKMGGFKALCGAERTHHIRLDRIQDEKGNGVPRGVAYALMVQSDVEVIVQYSRMDTSQAELALMTTMAFPMRAGRG